jgi:hypothetical protein
MAWIRIASIDPGISTGLVISGITLRTDYVVVHHNLSHTFDDPNDVLSKLQSVHCRKIVMEQKPRFPSKEGLDNWETIYQTLLARGYKLAKTLQQGDIDIKSSYLFLIQPSHWKPFMSSRCNEVPKTDSRHSKDAACMLHYFVRMNYQKEIKYG